MLVSARFHEKTTDKKNIEHNISMDKAKVDNSIKQKKDIYFTPNG
jgi:hypothetical protein